MNKIHFNNAIPVDYLKNYDNNYFFYLDDIHKTCKNYGLSCKGKKNDLINDILSIVKPDGTPKPDAEPKPESHYRGPGFSNKSLCVNREDFYTLESISTLDDTFFFSYKDENHVFFFDIRSFQILLENDNTNPYTINTIPQSVIHSFNKRKAFMIQNQSWEIHEKIDEESLTEEQKLNFRINDIVSKLDALNIVGGSVSPSWFSDLQYKSLQHYYKCLEDIWNYRANLNSKHKLKIIPNKEKLKHLFPHSVYNIMKLSIIDFPRDKLLYIILDIIDTLISSAVKNEDRLTGGYYVLTALTEISQQVASSIPWLVQLN